MTVAVHVHPECPENGDGEDCANIRCLMAYFRLHICNRFVSRINTHTRCTWVLSSSQHVMHLNVWARFHCERFVQHACKCHISVFGAMETIEKDGAHNSSTACVVYLNYYRNMLALCKTIHNLEFQHQLLCAALSFKDLTVRVLSVVHHDCTLRNRGKRTNNVHVFL